MDAVELPVAVAADGEEALNFVSLQPDEELIRLVLKAAEVGVAVFLVLAVRADHGRGENQDLPRRIAFLEDALKPFALGLAP